MEAKLMQCDVCGCRYMSNEKAKHRKIHEKFISAKNKYPFIMNYLDSEKAKREGYSEMNKPFSEKQISDAVSLVKAYFSQSYLNNPNHHVNFNDFMVIILNNRHEKPCSIFNDLLYEDLQSIYISQN